MNSKAVAVSLVDFVVTCGVRFTGAGWKSMGIHSSHVI